MGLSHSQTDNTPAPPLTTAETEPPLYLPKTHLPHFQEILFSLSTTLSTLSRKTNALLRIHHHLNQNPTTRYSLILSLYDLIDELKDVLKMFDSITLEEADDGVLLPEGIGELGVSVAYILGLAESVVACVEKGGNIPWMNEDRFVILLKRIGEAVEGLLAIFPVL